jgi:hypothetical protein
MPIDRTVTRLFRSLIAEFRGNLPFGQGQNLPQDAVALISINAVAGPGVQTAA